MISFCQTVTGHIKLVKTKFTLNENWILVLLEAIDVVLLKLVPLSLRKWILTIIHQSSLSRHPGQPRLYDRIRGDYYRPHLASNVSQVVSACYSCAQNGRKRNQKCHLQLLPVTDPLDLVSINILDLLPVTTKEQSKNNTSSPLSIETKNFHEQFPPSKLPRASWQIYAWYMGNSVWFTIVATYGQRYSIHECINWRFVNVPRYKALQTNSVSLWKKRPGGVL